IDWGWDDKRCFDYLHARFGVAWKKSCCGFCMFSGGKPEVIKRFRAEPRSGAEAIILERTARALNPRMTLYSRSSVEELIRADGNARAVVIADDTLSRVEWKLMRVQRIRMKKGGAHRRTEELARGTKVEMEKRLREESVLRNLPVTFEGGQMRLYILRPPEGSSYSTAEEMIVAVPGTVESNCRKNFTKRWSELVSQQCLFSTSAISQTS